RSALGEWMEGLAGPHGPVSFWSAYMHLYQHVMPEHKIYDSPSKSKADHEPEPNHIFLKMGIQMWEGACPLPHF
ncbi:MULTISPECIES: hypothetical protein, partial [unclassified Pseudomonas]|uniref:hypothetical protein n=1 Tax=unclassified Pseudomonas TaxID=196821 RepID=UPI001C49C985